MLGVGLLATGLVSLQVKRDIEQDAVKQFAFACDQVTLKIRERLGAYAMILRGGAGLFGASVSVERHAWHAYVEALQAARSIPGVQGIGFAQAIPAEQLAVHTARIRAEGFPEYTVRPAGKRAVYSSIIYLEPFSERNLRAFGFDMFAEPVRRAAMEQARDSGEATLSGKVQLVQETATDVQAGTLMYLPVYRNGAAVATVEQKRAALLGWAYSPYRMNDLMAGILANWESEQGKAVDLHIYDGSRAIPSTLLFENRSVPGPAPHSMFYQARAIDFNGRPWLLEFERSTAVSAIGYASAWSALMGGLALSGLLFGLMLSVINTRARAVRIAVELTAELKNTTAQLTAIFTLSPDGFITFDATDCVNYVSPAFTHMTGLNEHDMVGLAEDDFSECLAKLCAPEARFSGVAALGAMSAAGGAKAEGRQTIELAGVGKRVLQIGLRRSLVEPVSKILYVRDITRETEVDHMKTEFLSHAAHELRTPMASIFGFTELLITQKVDEVERLDFLDTIFRQSELMIAIINELLDLARIEARRGKDFILARVDVRDLLHDIITGFKTPRGRPSPQEPFAEAPLWVNVDHKKTIQAISNVISNAYKYSPDGGAVGIELVYPTNDTPLLGIRIADHGIGMTPAQLARVCERFYRADVSGKIPGTGLGMSIVKEIVELHGGELELSSTVGAGTTVTIWLPFAAPPESAQQS